MAQLATVPGVRFFGLQCGPGRAIAPGQPWLVDLGEGLDDFGETAAALAALDRLISVDTALLRLAGALGRVDSLWDPSLRLVRQPRPGDRAAVIAEVGVALRRRASA